MGRPAVERLRVRLRPLGHRLRQLGDKLPAAVVVGLAIVVATVILTVTAMRSQDEADDATSRAVSLASPIARLCAGNDETAHVLRSARTPDGKPVCDQAADIKDNPSAAAPSPTVDEARVLALVRQELAKLPAPAAAEPTIDQLTQVTREVLTRNPELFRGPKGEDGASGRPGPPPSSADITSVVAAFIRANPDMFPGRDCPVQPRQVTVDGYVMRACVVGRAPRTPQPTATTTVTETREPDPTTEPPPPVDSTSSGSPPSATN